MKALIGSIIVAAGLVGLIASVFQVFQKQWLWALLALMSALLIIAGWRLTKGDKLKDIIDDLLMGFPLP